MIGSLECISHLYCQKTIVEGSESFYPLRRSHPKESDHGEGHSIDYCGLLLPLLAAVTDICVSHGLACDNQKAGNRELVTCQMVLLESLKVDSSSSRYNRLSQFLNRLVFVRW